MGREFELKYSATEETLATVGSLWENWEEFSMETTYFDTETFSLSARNCTLRCRLENGISVCTVKTPTAGIGRGEWNLQAPWCADTTKYLFAQAGLEDIPFDQLTPVCGARFTRLATLAELPECTVEIALDRGVLIGGGKELPLCELEIELKSGSEAAALAWCAHFARRFDLQQESRSKFRRASLLAKGG